MLDTISNMAKERIKAKVNKIEELIKEKLSTILDKDDMEFIEENKANKELVKLILDNYEIELKGTCLISNPLIETYEIFAKGYFIDGFAIDNNLNVSELLKNNS